MNDDIRRPLLTRLRACHVGQGDEAAETILERSRPGFDRVVNRPQLRRPRSMTVLMRKRPSGATS
jgi:hypothetical protein